MIRISVLFFLLCLNAIAQVNDDRNIPKFSYIKVSHGVEVEYLHSDNYKVIVGADFAGHSGYIKTEVKDDNLIISIDRNYKGKTFPEKTKSGRIKGVKVYVQSPEIKGINVSLRSAVLLKNVIKTDNFDVHVSSSGELRGNIESNKCDINMSSSGRIYSDIIACNKLQINGLTSSRFEGNINADKLMVLASNRSNIQLSGDVEDAEVVLTESANVDAEKLNINSLNATVSKYGLGSFKVSNIIKAGVFSSGYLEYFGNPIKKDIKTSSGGVIYKKKTH